MRDGWIRTGARLLEDGFSRFAGPIDDLIKMSGQWVDSLEIEPPLCEHPAVKECAVPGFEMADRRMTIKAVVVLIGGIAGDDPLSADLRDCVKSKLLPFKYPRVIQYLGALPKTGTGKIDRQQLKRLGLGPSLEQYHPDRNRLMTVRVMKLLEKINMEQFHPK